MAVTPPARRSADTAVQLTTLPGWRQFTAAVPSVPDLLPGQDWLALEDGKRAAHDEERLEHHSRLVVVQTPVIGRIVTQGGNLIRMNRLAHYGRSGLMVSGPPRTGKTTAVTQLGKTVEVTHRHRNPGPGSRDDIPVIYITVPPAATGKMIAMEIARFLGTPVPRRANITDVIEQVCGICLDTRVNMIIVDELHNLDMTTRAGAEASDTLKYFSERLPSTFVYSGIGLDRGALLAGPRGDQVAGRFTLIPASAFTPGREWSSLVAAVEGSLRLYRHQDGALVTLADYLHRRTRGMIGSLLWLLRDASCQAILDGTEKLTRKSLDQVAVDMTAQAPPPRKTPAR
jgi:TniB protein